MMIQLLQHCILSFILYSFMTRLSLNYFHSFFSFFFFSISYSNFTYLSFSYHLIPSSFLNLNLDLIIDITHLHSFHHQHLFILSSVSYHLLHHLFSDLLFSSLFYSFLNSCLNYELISQIHNLLSSETLSIYLSNLDTMHLHD